MRLTDEIVSKHLELGGKLRIPKIVWVYAKLHGSKLYWFDERTNKFICCVDAFSDVVSNEWELVFPINDQMCGAV